MRVAIIAEVFLPKIDGVVHRTMNLIRQLTDLGDQVLVVCPQAEGCDRCSVPVVDFPSFSFPLYPEYRVGLPNKRLIEALERFQPDVVHYVNPFGFGFRCYSYLQKAGVCFPSVFSFHTLYGEFVKQYKALKPLSHLLWWMMREFHNCADVNITVSSIMQHELTRRGFERVEYWPPAVDGDVFRPEARSAAMRERLTNGKPDQKLLLTVSRLAPEKNVGFLAGLLDRVPDACLAIVGDGPQRAELESRFAGKNANFIGYLKGKELAAAYASADAFVYASETETMGNVVLEAMAAGSAVIAPSAGGIPSIVVPGQTGLLYSPGNLDEAVSHTRSILDDADLRTRLGHSARACVEGWSWTNSITQVRRLYDESLALHRSSSPRSKGPNGLARALLTTLVGGFKIIAPRNKAAAAR
jgi:glycosyltransferase involved in cell wall biosynthesis